MSSSERIVSGAFNTGSDDDSIDMEDDSIDIKVTVSIWNILSLCCQRAPPYFVMFEVISAL